MAKKEEVENMINQLAIEYYNTKSLQFLKVLILSTVY